MEIPKIAPISRVDAVVNGLAHFIAEAELQPGHRLPPERILSKRLGVSRASLREALRHLAALKVVESRTGSGTYLLSRFTPDDDHLVMHLEAERESLLQLLELRRALETEVVALVAKRADEEQVFRLDQLVDALETEHDQKGRNSATDEAFHRALYEYAGNPLFLQIYDSIWSALERFWHSPLGKDDFASRTVPYHRLLVERIRERDSKGAREMVIRILAIVEEDLRVES